MTGTLVSSSLGDIPEVGSLEVLACFNSVRFLIYNVYINPFKRRFKGLSGNIGAFIIRTGFWGVILVEL